MKDLKIQVTSRLRETYPGVNFAAFVVSGVSNEKKSDFLEKEKEVIVKRLEKTIKDPKDLPVVKDHNKFFNAFGKTVPIEYQLNTVLQKKNIPTESILKDSLFMIEMKYGHMVSGHDLDYLEKELVFDLNEGNGPFTKISGKDDVLTVGDIVLKDKDEVITSLILGPGSKDKITKDSQNVLYVYWFFEKVSKKELDNSIKDFKNYLQKAAGKDVVISDVGFEDVIVERSSDVVINPYDVKGVVDYERLVKDFGIKKLDDKLLKRIEKIAGEVHPLLRRGMFFAHRDLEKFLDDFEKGKKVCLYTGVGPSGPITIGHYYIWSFAKWLQDVFDCDLWFQFTDDEKFLYKDLSLDEINKWTKENALDVMAIGFNPEKTHFLIDTMHAGVMYPLAVQVAKKITTSTIKSSFGFTDTNNIGSMFFTSMQTVPAILPSVIANENVRCLIPLGVDQDPHFRISRDVVQKLGFYKPSVLHGKMMPSLTGIGEKGSSSNPDKVILMSDTEKQIKSKVNKHAFSGGKETVEEHRKLGGDVDVDIACQWLVLFEEDDEKLQDIHEKYRKGELLSGEVKKILIEKLAVITLNHQKLREERKNMLDDFLYKQK